MPPTRQEPSNTRAVPYNLRHRQSPSPTPGPSSNPPVRTQAKPHRRDYQPYAATNAVRKMKKGATARGYSTRPPRLPPPPKNVPSKRVRFTAQQGPVTPSPRTRSVAPSSGREAAISSDLEPSSEAPLPPSEPPKSSPGREPPSLPNIDKERRIHRDYERTKRAYN